MKIKTILDECFQDYKKTSMLIGMCSCDWKCLKEQGLPIEICHNSNLAQQQTIDIPMDKIIRRYVSNPITKAIIFAGLEPMLQFDDIVTFINELRSNYKIDDDIVIYTGYYPDEVEEQINILKQYENIIVKFGRYQDGGTPKYDEVLGINLITSNQYAVKIS